MHIYVPLSIIAICWAIPAIGADAPDFNTFYNLYKTAGATNDITITSDITSTRLISVPGANTTTINGGGFDFAGGGFGGFIVSNGYDFSVSDVGAFSTDETNATIDKSFHNFINASEGGVISNLGGNVSIKNSAFSNNVSSLGGGALYQNNNGTIDVSDSVFQSNQATRGDGGVIYNEYETSATFNNSFFSNNSARDYGGVAFNDGTLNITGGSFVSNTAESGGALYNSNTMNISGAQFMQNTATDGAGAIYTTGDMILNNTTFENNSGSTGGAIGNYGIIGDTLYSVVQDSVFTNNSAEYGGAIYNWDDMYVIDSQFTSNTATSGGGAIFNLAELYLIALDNDISFSNNALNGKSNAVESSGTIGMNAAAGKSIIFDDAISGTGDININRNYIFNSENVPTGGNIILNADMSEFHGNITQYNGTVRMGDNATFFSADNLNIIGGTLDIGTHAINATNATFGANSTLQISVQNSDVYGYINANSITITDGANMNVILQPNAMGTSNTMQLHILRGQNEITDNFAPHINNNIYAFSQMGNGWYSVSSIAEYDDIIRDAGGTQNNMNTATAWQDAPPASHATEHELYMQMNALLQTDAAGYVRALSALAPSPAPLMQIIGTQLTSRTDDIISGPHNEYDTGNGKIWASVIGNIGQLDTGLQYSKFDMRGIGGGVGAEYGASDITLGAAYTFQYDKIYNWARDIRATTDGGAAYIKYRPGDFILRGVATMFYTDMHETKNVANLHLDNNSSVYTYGAWSDIGYKISSYDWDITPGAGVQYTLVHRRTSTDDAGQRIDGDNLNFWTAYTNTTFAYYGFDFGKIQFVPSVTLGLAYDMYSDNDIFDITVNNNRYEIVGTKLPRWAGNIGANLNMTFNQYGEISIGIDAQMRDNYNNISATIRAAMRF